MTAEVDSSRPTPTASARSRSTGPSAATAGRRTWRTPTDGALTDAAADQGVRAVVVTGAGTTFCPGADMGRLGDLAAEGASLPHRPVDVPRTFPKPLIAAINGACAGVGLVQALFCHVRFAADTARFSTAFARRGLVAEYGIAWTLPRLVGLENALDLLLSARTFDAVRRRHSAGEPRRAARRGADRGPRVHPRHRGRAPLAVAVIAAQVRMVRRHLR